jgi:hypothetical protein
MKRFAIITGILSGFLFGIAKPSRLAPHTPNGYYNIERMLKAVLMKKGKVKLC